MTDEDPRIREAFLRQTDVVFYDPAIAFSMGDWSGAVGEDGEVDPDALLRAFDNLVTTKAYLVKGGYEPPTEPSGESVGSGLRRTFVTHDEAALRVKYRGL